MLGQKTRWSASGLTAEDAKVFAKAAKKTGSPRPSAQTFAPFALKTPAPPAGNFDCCSAGMRGGRAENFLNG